jgi:hypothetical protein
MSAFQVTAKPLEFEDALSKGIACYGDANMSNLRDAMQEIFAPLMPNRKPASYYASMGHASECDEAPQISMADYHAHQAIGASTAKLALKSLQLFDDARRGVYVQADRPHFQIGTLVHMMVLEPEKFARLVTTLGPINPATGKMYGRDSLKFAAWQAENPGVVVVEQWIFLMLARMPPEVKALLKGTVSESSVFAELGGLQVKCRPDALKPGLIIDLKTCDDVDKIERDIAKLKYWFTAAWYRAVMRAATGQRHAHKFVFVEKSPPYRWRIVDLDAGYNMHGDSAVNAVVDSIYAASQAGDFSDHGDIDQMVGMPQWMEIEAEGEDDDAL